MDSSESRVGQFRMERWNYHIESIEEAPLVHSSNGSEGQNSKFNNRFRCVTNLTDAILELRSYKGDEIVRYREIMNGEYRSRRPDTIERHRQLKELVSHFSTLDVVNQVYQIIDTSLAIGKLMTCVHK